MKLKMVYGLLLFLMSFSVFSDTYPIIVTTQNACNAWAVPPIYTGFIEGMWCYKKKVSSGLVYDQTLLSTFNNQSCPGGGTVSGANCIDAPVCVSPQVRSSITGMCSAPVCAPPKFINSFGICEIPECTTYKVPNELTGVCQIPPVCGSTEQYQNSTNTCILKPLDCPGHSHASTSNDACLPDAPNACPVGQHDDGTYTCVADDPTACRKDQQSGYINGVRQCISSPPPDTAQQEAQDRADAEAANNASNADPTNVGLANQANNESNQAQVNGVGMSNDLLRSIANSANDAENREKGNQAGEGGDNCNQPPPCVGDPIQCEILKQSHKNSCRTIPDPQLTQKEVGGNTEKIAGVFGAGIASDMGTGAFSGQQYVSTGFFNLGSSSCQTVPMVYKALNYTFNPCAKLEIFRNLLGWFFYMYTAFSIVQLARQS